MLRLSPHLLLIAAWLMAATEVGFSADRLATVADSRSLSERISAPDLSREVKVTEFRPGGVRSPASKQVREKEFYWIQKSLRKKAATSEFYPGKSAISNGKSIGARKYGTRQAYFGEAAAQEKEKQMIRTETFETKIVHDADATVKTREDTAAGKVFSGRGTAQGSLDKMGSNGETLTVDQVREILNRNK